MKICKIYIKGFQQFQDVELDFTDPETEEPVEKVCFIGSNGTGKSTILGLIFDFIDGDFFLGEKFNESAICIQGLNNNEFFAFIYFGLHGIFVDQNHPAISDFKNLDTKAFFKKYGEEIKLGVTPNMSWNELDKDRLTSLYFTLNTNCNLIYSPSESDENNYLKLDDVPETSLNEALRLNHPALTKHLVSHETIKNFWQLLIFYIKKREVEREVYETRPENINKTKAQLIEEFDRINPKILVDLGEIWDKILNKAGLTFDSVGARNPVQLSDNLKAYIKLLNSDRIIPYKNLSTGIRNYIFRLGHIFSLYYNREIARGLLLIDEPENSLYPDFLFELVATYQEVIKDKRGVNNTQMFFATHNPIIAAQFKPHERIILEWKEDGSVKANKGITPEGDDPNDILKKDFGLHQLMGPVGIQQWNKYLELKKKLKDAQSMDDKMHIASEVNEIGRLYNFPA